jgi:multidrug efflux pump subunit AcrA (membrane-fusion protein)
MTATLVVPATAVQAMQGDTVVIVSEPRGEGMYIKAVPVRVGRRTTDRVEILGGVPSGAAVVVRGAAIAKAELLKRRGGE